MIPRAQSTQARHPSRTGAPDGPGCQATPSNLSPPDTAKFRHRASWWLDRTLTQKAPARAMRGQLVELLAGARATIGGSRDSEVNDWQVNPTGAPSSMAVTTVTPVG